MTLRRPASRLLFWLACLIWGGALVLLIQAKTLPAAGMEDLARTVGAMFLAATSVLPFALALFVGRGTQMPRWMLIAAWVGLAIAAVPAIALLSVRFT